MRKLLNDPFSAVDEMVDGVLIAYGEVTRNGQVFSVLDPPADDSAAQIITYVNSTAAIGGLTEFAAMYWPRVKVLNGLSRKVRSSRFSSMYRCADQPARELA